MTDGLKPCPFCKGTRLEINFFMASREDKQYCVQCMDRDCFARGPRRGSREEAEEAWNKRPRKAKVVSA